MRAFIVALIDMASRPGEVRTLQWKNINLQRRTWVIEASKEKTRTERSGLLSTRLWQLLAMRQFDPAGQPWAGDAYVFGDEIGRALALATIRDRWDALVERVGLTGLQMRDMRHEGANQYEESGTPISDVSLSSDGTARRRSSRPGASGRRRGTDTSPGTRRRRGADGQSADSAAIALRDEPKMLGVMVTRGRRRRSSRWPIRGWKYHKMPHLACLGERVNPCK